MSYRRRGLGQAKIVPGQVNFLAVRESYLPFREPGYVEHGSWVTGAPDIVQFQRPERARGLLGLGQTLTDFACSGTALNASWEARTRTTLSAAAQAAVAGGVLAGVVGAITKKPAIGAVIGGALAFGAMRVWTAPYQV